MIQIRSTPLRLPFLLALLSLAGVAAADVAYSNLTNFSGFGADSGGASGTSGTILVADDLHLAAGTAGERVTGFTDCTADYFFFNVSVTAHVRFYADDGFGGRPGTLLAARDFDQTLVPTSPPDEPSLSSYTDPAGFFVVPTDEVVWAGIYFTSATASVEELNHVGQGLFYAPTIGSTEDFFFQSSAPGNFDGNDPVGGYFHVDLLSGSGFGWAITTATPVPEPAPFAALGVGAMGMLRRRKRA